MVARDWTDVGTGELQCHVEARMARIARRKSAARDLLQEAGDLVSPRLALHLVVQGFRTRKCVQSLQQQAEDFVGLRSPTVEQAFSAWLENQE